MGRQRSARMHSGEPATQTHHTYKFAAAVPLSLPARLSQELVQTAHAGKVNALAFPEGYGEVFATGGPGGIRLWALSTCKELLRIAVPNLECNCLAFTPVRPLRCCASFAQAG